jgi:hypothetical protein
MLPQLRVNNSASSQGPSNVRKPRARWDPAIETTFIDALLQGQEKELQTDNAGFKPAGWDIALKGVQEATTQLKVKYDTIKQDCIS